MGNTYLDSFFTGGAGVQIQDDGSAALPKRTYVNLTGNLVPTDNASTDSTDLKIINIAPVYNVRDYGAKGDGITDDLAAFNACQNAILALGSGGVPVGTRFYVPPANPGQFYKLSDNFYVLTPSIYEGVGTGFAGVVGSELRFPPGKGLRIYGFAALPDRFGDGTNSEIRGLTLRQTGAMTLPLVARSTPYAVGATVRCLCKSGVDASGVGNGQYIVYYECVSAGTTGSAARDYWVEEGQTVDVSVQWAAGLSVKYGTTVRSTDPSLAAVFFVQLTNASRTTFLTTGSSEPSWNTTPGATTTDNGITWTCKSSVGNIVIDGAAVFAVRTAAVVFHMTQTRISRCYIEALSGPAIHNIGNATSFPISGTSGSWYEHSSILLPTSGIGAVGISIQGGDASASVGYSIQLTGAAMTARFCTRRAQNHPYSVNDIVVSNESPTVWQLFKCTTAGTSANSPNDPAWNYTIDGTTVDGGATFTTVPTFPEYGIYDRGFAGNRWVGCFTQEFSAPGVALISSANSGASILGYSENYSPDVYHANGTTIGSNSTSGTHQLGGGFAAISGACQNLNETKQSKNVTGAPSVTWRAQIADANISAWNALLSSDDNSSSLSHVYTGDGWWTFCWATQPSRAGYAYSNSAALFAGHPLGAAVFRMPRGIMWGGATATDANSPPFFQFSSVVASQDYLVAGCYRPVNSRRPKSATPTPGDYADQIVTTAGYEAPTWVALTYYAPEGTGRPATAVVPATPNGFAYAPITTDGTSAASGPASVSTRWSAAATIALNDTLVPTHTHWNGFFYKATSIGSSPHQTGGTEPTWPTGVGATVLDGDITWTRQGAAWGLQSGETTVDGSLTWTWLGAVAVWKDCNLIAA